MSKWFRTGYLAKAPERVDREAGVIHGAAVVTAGEARGHGVHLDSEFVQKVVEYGNAKEAGLKARHGHPSMSGDALGTFIGRWTNFRVDGDVARADLHLAESAAKSPNGNLREYMLTLAEESPDMFGTSIVFEPGKRYQRDDSGQKLYNDLDREAPVFVECSALHACDAVDEPAANPDGLFGDITPDTIAGRVATFLDENPDIVELLADHPEVAEGFMVRYNECLERRGEDTVPQLVLATREYLDAEIATAVLDEMAKTEENLETLRTSAEEAQKAIALRDEQAEAYRAEIAEAKAEAERLHAEIARKEQVIQDKERRLRVLTVATGGTDEDSGDKRGAEAYHAAVRRLTEGGMTREKAALKVQETMPELYQSFLAEFNRPKNASRRKE